MQEYPKQAFSKSSDVAHGVFVDAARQAPLASYLPVYGHHPFFLALRHQKITVVGEALRASHAHRELTPREELPCGLFG
jgi:hypothetical protein